MKIVIKEDKREEIEGVVHVDGTSRIQTVFDKQDNPFIFDLLTFLDAEYDIKALINTSFNIKDKTMVLTPKDALNTFYNTNLDILIIENFLIYK